MAQAAASTARLLSCTPILSETRPTCVDEKRKVGHQGGTEARCAAIRARGVGGGHHLGGDLGPVSQEVALGRIQLQNGEPGQAGERGEKVRRQ